VFFPHGISKPDASRITKLDIEMFRHEYWKLIYFGVKRSEVKVTSHKNVAGVGLCTLVSAGSFYCYRIFLGKLRYIQRWLSCVA